MIAEYKPGSLACNSWLEAQWLQIVSISRGMRYIGRELAGSTGRLS